MDISAHTRGPRAKVSLLEKETESSLTYESAANDGSDEEIRYIKPMKTNTRNLKMQWLASNEKTGQVRVAFGNKKVSTTEFDSASLLTFINRGEKFAQLITDMVNGQAHIKFGSTCARKEIEEMIGEKARHDAIDDKGNVTKVGNSEDAKALWNDEKIPVSLDYVKACEESALSERAGKLSAFDKWLASLGEEKLAKFKAMPEEKQKATREAYEAQLKALAAFGSEEEEEGEE